MHVEMMEFYTKSYRVLLLAFSVFCLIIASPSHGYEDGTCDLVSNELRDNIVRDLYSIERGLKLLSRDDPQDFHRRHRFGEVSMILHEFLSSNATSQYLDVQQKLRKLITLLSLSAKANHTNLGVVLDFSKHAVVKAKQTQKWIQQLSQCNKNITPKQGQLLGSMRDNSDSCFVDGTKCQYRSCAKGKRLPLCAIGFATGVTGGASGSYYVVTRDDDNHMKNPTPGTLRHAIDFAGSHKGGAWITFARNMIIRLNNDLWINSDTTIDGRGVNVTVLGYRLVLANVENVILHNFEVVSTGYRDTVHVFDRTRKVWIDHMTSRDADLGLVTVVEGSTDVTVSNCYLSNHNFNMLLGASDSDTIDQNLRVTVYRNWFDSSTQRMPHCRWGYCHVVNNYYKNWHYYAIGGRAHAKILSERNVFQPGERPEVTPWNNKFTSDLTPVIHSNRDLLLNGATFHEFLTYGKPNSPESVFPNYRLPHRPTQSVAKLVISCAGVLIEDKVRKCIVTP